MKAAVEFTPEQIEVARNLVAHTIHALKSSGFHGHLGRIHPGKGRVEVILRDVSPNHLFEFISSTKIRRAKDRWRLYYPADNGMPPLVLRLSGKRIRYRDKTIFVINKMESSFVGPPNCE